MPNHEQRAREIIAEQQAAGRPLHSSDDRDWLTAALRTVEREALEWVADLDMQQIKLQMGELTAQEERTLRAFQSIIRAPIEGGE